MKKDDKERRRREHMRDERDLMTDEEIREEAAKERGKEKKKSRIGFEPEETDLLKDEEHLEDGDDDEGDGEPPQDLSKRMDRYVDESVAYSGYVEDEVSLDSGREEDIDDTSLDNSVDETRMVDSVHDSPLGYVRVDIEKGNDPDDDEPLTADETDDYISIGTNQDEVMNQIDDYTADEDVIEEFEERQGWTQGSDQLLEDINQHHSRSPDLSANDIDATWEYDHQSGEESVGGTVPTPDQDIVGELGEAVGINYEDDEPLNTADKLAERDRNRWEMNPESAEEDEEDEEDEEEDQG